MDELIKRFLRTNLMFDGQGNYYIKLSDGKVFENFPEVMPLLHNIFDTIITTGLILQVISEIKNNIQ